MKTIPQTTIFMKTKLALKFDSIQTLTKKEQKSINGGGGASSPCCPSSPYFNQSSCANYAQAMGCSNVPIGGIWCDPSWSYKQFPDSYNGVSCRR